VEIGKVLWRTLSVDGTRGNYFGKYEVIRAFDPSQIRLFGADIIVINDGARVNTLENVQRIVDGYLETSFGLSPADAARLGVLITKYNAAHRSDIAYLSQKYSPEVMSHLTTENAGMALSYVEWPGRTRLLIPLGHAANGQPSVGVTPGQAGKAAPFAPSSGARTTGPDGKGAGATGGTGVMGGTTSREGGAAGEPATATRSESQGVGSQTSALGASRVGTGFLGRFLSTGNLRWLMLLVFVMVAILALIIAGILRAGLSPAWARAILRSVREGHPLVEMVVTTQNRRIGMRNVHYLRPGASATVGGGRSMFLIYFVPVPRRMAILTYDGKKYTFVPRKVELFPSLVGPIVDCLGKVIPAKSARGYPFTIVFRAFVSPLEVINRLMNSIRVPR
jgi:hypothetical protein